MMKGTKMTALPQNATEALKLMAKAQFRPFDDADWNSWSGCETDEPMIAEIDEVTIIIDGDCITFNAYNDGTGSEWTSFTLRFDGAY
jgi:hypothetical protein